MALTAEDRLAFQTAEDALAGGRYDEARWGFHRYLKRRLEAVRHDRDYLAPDAVAIERLAELSSHLGGAEPAEDLLEGLAELYHRVGNSLCERLAIMRLAHLQLRRGAVRSCRDTLDRLQAWSGLLEDLALTPSGLLTWESERDASPGSLDGRSVTFALWYLLLGRICAANGRYDAAEAAYARGLAHAQAPEAGGYESALRLARAQALLETGEMAEALGQCTFATGEEGPDSIAGIETAARIHSMAGRLGEAKTAYESAIERADRMRLSFAAAALRLSLAHLLILINQTDRAQADIAAAAEAAAAIGANELLRRARTLDAIARLRRQSGLDAATIAPSVMELQTAPGQETAPASPDEGVDVAFPPQESFLGTLEDRLVEFQHSLNDPEVSRAEGLMKLLEEFGTSGSPVVHARVDVARGLWHYRNGLTESARRCFGDAESELTRLGLLIELRQLRRYQMWCAARNGDRRGLDDLRRDEAVLLTRLTESLAGGDQGYFWLNKWSADEEALAARLNDLEQLQRRCEASRWLRPLRRARLWMAVARFVAKLDDHRQRRLREALDLGGSATASAGPWWLRLLRYPRTRAVVSCLVLPDRLFMGCVWRFGARFDVRPVSRIDVRALVRQFHEAVVEEDDAVANRVLGDATAALGLNSLLARLPSRVSSLSVIPDDALLGLPFGVLLFEGDLVLRRWAVSHCARWSAPKTRRVVTSSLLVSASDPGGQFAPLDDARREVDLVEKTCRLPAAAVRRLDDKEATRSRLIEALRGPSLWHVACHGVFAPDSPGSSGIVLPGTDRARPDVLALRDLAGLRLSGLRLAFLSSCSSADNFVAPGRWVLSLPYTLHAAGAETVVGSLWELLDDVAAQFTELFYRHARSGIPCDQALQRAMLACRQGDEGRPRPLWDWAGFVLTGDPSPLGWSSRRMTVS